MLLRPFFLPGLRLAVRAVCSPVSIRDCDGHKKQAAVSSRWQPP